MRFSKKKQPPRTMRIKANHLLAFSSMVKIALTFSFLTFCGQNMVRAKEIKAFENYDLVLPFLWATDVNDNLEFTSIINGTLVHPLTIGRAAFTFLYTGIETNNQLLVNKGLKILKVLDEYPYQRKSGNSTLYLYPEDYEVFVGMEWWSGMANSAIGVSYLLAFEITEDEKFKTKAVSAMNGVINPIAENGCAIELNEDASWYLEYADLNRADSNAYFVHNGFMYSLAALKYFENVLEEEVYSKSFEKGIKALNLKEKDFFYADLKWTYYMQNPRTVESLHHAIFELILLDALISEDRRSFLKQSAHIRREIIKKEYSLNLDEYGKMVVNLISGPHLYWQDLYPTRIIAHQKDGDSSVYHFIPRDFSTSIVKRLFLDISDLKDNLDSLEIFQDYCGRSFKLFSLLPQKTYTMHQGYVKCNIAPGKQSTLVNDHEITVTSETEINRAMVRYLFPNTIDLYHCSFFGWTFTSEIPILSLRIDLINSRTESCGRNFVPQPQDTLNLILLKGFSFEKYSTLSTKRIKEIQVNYFYAPFKGDPKKITFSNVFATDNPPTLYYIMNKKFGEFNFEETESDGNIY